MAQQAQQTQDSLQALMAHKADLESHLAKLERQIYELEGKYLEDNSTANIVKGYDGYLGSKGKGQGRKGVREQDRIFSGSSSTSPLNAHARQALEGAGRSEKTGRSKKSVGRPRRQAAIAGQQHRAAAASSDDDEDDSDEGSDMDDSD
eukprot:m51a1_g582 hypothetical protein (148) ;mRNA; r:3159-3809